MPSNARETLIQSLSDVQEVINAHSALNGGGAGRPAQRQGQATTRAGVVLLCAAMEQFLEDLFEEAAPLIYPTATQAELDRLFQGTTRRLNHPGLHQVTVMYFSIGMNHPFNTISWRKMNNASFRNKYDDFLQMRGRIAHGRRPNVRLQTLRLWKSMVEQLSVGLERLVCEHILRRTGNAPNW